MIGDAGSDSDPGVGDAAEDAGADPGAGSRPTMRVWILG